MTVGPRLAYAVYDYDRATSVGCWSPVHIHSKDPFENSARIAIQNLGILKQSQPSQMPEEN